MIYSHAIGGKRIRGRRRLRGLAARQPPNNYTDATKWSTVRALLSRLMEEESGHQDGRAPNCYAMCKRILHCAYRERPKHNPKNQVQTKQTEDSGDADTEDENDFGMASKRVGRTMSGSLARDQDRTVGCNTPLNLDNQGDGTFLWSVSNGGKLTAVTSVDFTELVKFLNPAKFRRIVGSEAQLQTETTSAILPVIVCTIQLRRVEGDIVTVGGRDTIPSTSIYKSILCLYDGYLLY